MKFRAGKPEKKKKPAKKMQPTGGDVHVPTADFKVGIGAAKVKKQDNTRKNLELMRAAINLLMIAIDKFLEEEEPEEIHQPIPDDIEVGDHVVVNQPMDHHHGREGVIEEVAPYEGGDHAVRFDDNARAYYVPEQLELPMGDSEIEKSTKPKKTKPKVSMRKAAVDVDDESDMFPGIDNLEGGLLKSGDEEEGIDLQRLVEGIDWETENSTADEISAKELALQELGKDPNHYRKLKMEEEGTDDELEKDTRQTEEDQFANEGYSIDLGSGSCREPGHVGFDLYPHDIGTIVHDLHLGIPLEDGTVQKARLVNSLHTMDELSQDPKPLLSEIHRTMMPGGQFTYQGPNEIYNQQNQDQWGQDYPGFVLTNHEDNCDEVGKDNSDAGTIYSQSFTRLATPDPATANDAEPRIGVSNEDMLPADALIAMDAMGYYFSDATSSGRGNRIHGYPSQGALVDEPTESGTSYTGKWMKKSEGDDAIPPPTREELEVQDALNPPPVNPPKPKAPARTAAKVEKILKSGKIVPILKTNAAKQIVYGVVLAPDEIDSQDDFMEADDIEKAAHKYLSASRVIGGTHEKQIDATPVESFIAPQDLEINGQNGPQVVKKGSWVLGVKIHDPGEWDRVVNGEYTGFSVGGQGQRQHT